MDSLVFNMRAFDLAGYNLYEILGGAHINNILADDGWLDSKADQDAIKAGYYYQFK